MLKTIKSKIIFLTLSMLIVLGVVTSLFAESSYSINKKLKNESCDLMVAYFAERINKSIRQLEENTLDLALMGKIFYNETDKNHSTIDEIVRDNFAKQKLSVGGGIWYEPYIILPSVKRFCSYAFFDNEKIKTDPNFEKEKYNYLNQMWYKVIKKNVSKEKRVVWTAPYFDETGTHSLMTTLGSAIYNDNNEFIGLSTVDWKLDSIIEKISTIRPTKNSFALFADVDNDYILALTEMKTQNEEMVGKSLKELSWYKNYLMNGQKITYKGVEYISYKRVLNNNMILIVNVPVNELYAEILKKVEIMGSLLTILSFIIAFGSYFILKRNILKPINYLMHTAEIIGSGDLETEIVMEKPEEFAKLAKSFNQMTKDIKEHITNLNIITLEKNRIQSELDIAKSIQLSSLPSVFPPYPERKEFDIYAKMIPAKEVGGDFYDFFFIDNDHFAFLIADVSGKGVPAALFMMTTKTLIKNLAKSGISASEIVTKANKNICKTNKEGLFVTLFLSILELSTGKITYVNAGHNPPLVKRDKKTFEYFKSKPNLVVGAMENLAYVEYEAQLNPNDMIFLYTDGVTEAFSIENEQFGENRLAECLNSLSKDDMTVEKVVENIKAEVFEFSNSMEQSDDITILVLKYNEVSEVSMQKNEVEKTKTFLLPANVKRLDSVVSWLDKMLIEAEVPNDCKMKLNLALEEIFVNISTYAYPPKCGDVEITFKINDGKQIEMQFIDNGTPYNPLEKPDPDITLSAENRPVGGLGIFMVKQIMDYMGYEYLNGKNILTLKLNFKN